MAQGGKLFHWDKYRVKWLETTEYEWDGEHPGRQEQVWPYLWGNIKWHPHPSFSNFSSNLTLNWVSDGKVLSRLSGGLKQIPFTSSHFPNTQTNHFIDLADNIALFPNLKKKIGRILGRWVSSESTRKLLSKILLNLLNLMKGDLGVTTMRSKNKWYACWCWWEFITWWVKV